MKIGVISDLHGYPKKFERSLEILKDCEVILCAGDILYHGPRNPILEGYNPIELAEKINKSQIPVIIAKGNCDADVDGMVLDVPAFSPVVFYEKDGLRVIVLHGHDFDDAKLKSMAKFYKANLVITGHTHIRKYEKIESTIYINPGSIAVPKGDGIASCVKIEDGKIEFINLENGEILEEYSL
ncbi:MAG: phosphodiesterase [Caloramator sp.]|nr:phosphodiesterase [Caloramator sp.]